MEQEMMKRERNATDSRRMGPAGEFRKPYGGPGDIIAHAPRGDGSGSPSNSERTSSATAAGPPPLSSQALVPFNGSGQRALVENNPHREIP